MSIFCGSVNPKSTTGLKILRASRSWLWLQQTVKSFSVVLFVYYFIFIFISVPVVPVKSNGRGWTGKVLEDFQGSMRSSPSSVSGTALSGKLPVSGMFS
jgi:hypothetical protein